MDIARDCRRDLNFGVRIGESNFQWLILITWFQKKPHNSFNPAAKLLQSCPTLCDPIDGSPPGSPVPGILQARTLEWVAISFSNVRKWEVKVELLSPVWLLAIPWTAAHQAPPSMGFSRQECWSGVPLPSPPLTLACLNYKSIIMAQFLINSVRNNLYSLELLVYTSLTSDKYIPLCSTLRFIVAATCETFGAVHLCI